MDLRGLLLREGRSKAKARERKGEGKVGGGREWKRGEGRKEGGEGLRHGC